MTKRLLLVFAIAALAVASAKTYSINLLQAATLGDMQLAPGTYDVDVMGDKAVVTNGKMHGEAPVKVQEMETKYKSTTVQIGVADGKNRIQEIHIGGSKTKLVFAE